jgi:hypothetical protein
MAAMLAMYAASDMVAAWAPVQTSIRIDEHKPWITLRMGISLAEMMTG